MQSALVDTNLLVYVAVAEEPEKRELLKKFFLQLTGLCISSQSIRELAAVLAIKYSLPKKTIHEEIENTRNAYGLLLDLLEDVPTAVGISSDYKIPFWDALLIATADRNGIETIYTENVKDFSKFKKIRVINPFTDIH